MDINFEGSKKMIVDALAAKVANLKCPVCDNSSLTFGGGFFAHDLQQDLSQRQIGGVNIPTVPIVCSNCGYVMEFAAGTLGLLPKKEEQKKEELGEPEAKESHGDKE